jgi:hypothetical protein
MGRARGKGGYNRQEEGNRLAACLLTRQSDDADARRKLDFVETRDRVANIASSESFQ